MKNIINFVCLMSILMVTACGGRSANLVAAEEIDDQYLTCKEIKAARGQVEVNIKNLIPNSSKTGKNITLGIAGAFLIFPWFFMDLSNAEKKELKAFEARYNALTSLAEDAGCEMEIAR